MYYNYIQYTIMALFYTNRLNDIYIHSIICNNVLLFSDIVEK